MRVIVLESASQAEKIKRILKRLPEDKTLTTRQMEMLSGILDGKTRKEIAADLCLSENTVKTHVASLYEALGVSKKEELFALFQEE